MTDKNINKECFYCGNFLDEDEQEYLRTDEVGDVICDECYYDECMNRCCLCEDYYEKPTKPEELFFVVSKEARDEVGIEDFKPGIYQTTSWPYYYGCLVEGFQSLFESSIKLVRELDINSMMRKLYQCHENIGANEICPLCAEKYGKPSFEHIKYTNKFHRIHGNINKRAAIINGE